MEEMDPPSSMPRRRIYSVTGYFAPKLVKYIFDVNKRKKILVWHELFVLRKSQGYTQKFFLFCILLAWLYLIVVGKDGRLFTRLCVEYFE